MISSAFMAYISANPTPISLFLCWIALPD